MSLKISIRRIFSINMILALIIIALNVLPVHAAGVLYAKPGGTGDCSSWAHACTLQTALTGAASGEEIWAAAGTYKPTTVVTDRAATFQLKNGVALYGGFAGTESARNQRDPVANLTVLSGDIDNNDTQTPVITDLATVAGNTTNSYAVVTGANGATLDGFTITAGNASGKYPYWYGGGMYNDSSSPVLTNVIFSGNYAGPSFPNESAGGGMYNLNGSNPVLTHVTFSSNSSGAYGGGMYNGNDSNPTLTDVTFSGNSSQYGGGMFNSSSSPILTNATFSGNSGWQGGGIFNDDESNPTLTGITFRGNTTTYQGGGMYNGTSNPTLTNIIFSNNSSRSGGGMCNNGGSPTLTSVTFSENSGIGMFNLGSATLTSITFSENSGGGIELNGGNPTFTNVTFSGNSSSGFGGGMRVMKGSPTLTNVTFIGNSAEIGGGGVSIDNYVGDAVVMIRNTIFWGNTALYGEQIDNISLRPVVLSLSDSVVQDGYAAATNIITADPMLGTLGDYGGLTQTIPLLAGSSAIDAGNTATCAATDQRGYPRPVDGDGNGSAICDIGAYEFGALPINVYLPLVVISGPP